MARRSDHTREELKTMILDAAWGIVGKDGAAGLTARRVAAEIGYVPGTIYNIFESMDALVVQVNGRTLDLMYAALSEGHGKKSAHNPVAEIKNLANGYMKFARDYHPYWMMLFTTRAAEGDVSGWYQDKVDRVFDPLEDILRPLFPAGKDDNRKMAARVLWSSVHGLFFLQQTGKIHVVSERAASDMMSYLIETFVAGIGKNYSHSN